MSLYVRGGYGPLINYARRLGRQVVQQANIWREFLFFVTVVLDYALRCSRSLL